MNGAASRKWSPEDDTKLRQWALEGLSASKMARALGGVSRSAIIGRLHRIGVSLKMFRTADRIRKESAGGATKRLRTKRLKEQREKDGANQQGAGRRSAWPFQAVPDDTLERLALSSEESRVGCLDDLEPHHCRYPIGGADEGPQRFCGDRKIDGLPYCSKHAVRCYMPPKPRNVSRETLSAPRLKVVA